MKTILIVIAVVVAAPFLIGFGWAAVQSLTGKRQKREQAQAKVLLSQIPEGAFGVLLLVFAAFKSNDASKANQLVIDLRMDALLLLETLNRPRDPMLSSGDTGDPVNLEVWRKTLAEQGYEEIPAMIVAYVHHHYLESVLEEVVERRGWEAASNRV